MPTRGLFPFFVITSALSRGNPGLFIGRTVRAEAVLGKMGYTNTRAHPSSAAAWRRCGAA